MTKPKELTKGQVAAQKAIKTWKMANTLAKALGRRYSKRWQFVDFLGPKGRESAGIVDILAIRKSNKAPTIAGLQKLDLFEILVIQVKGGSAKEPSDIEIERMRKVAEHYHASAVVLFQWRKGLSVETGYKLLHETKNEWSPVSAKKLFGK
jgi:hypothetical protein